MKPEFDLKKHPDLAPDRLSELAKTAVKALYHAWPEVNIATIVDLVKDFKPLETLIVFSSNFLTL